MHYIKGNYFPGKLVFAVSVFEQFAGGNFQGQGFTNDITGIHFVSKDVDQRNLSNFVIFTIQKAYDKVDYNQ